MAGGRVVGGIKRTQADIAFSNCVRERAGWACERCRTYYQEGNRGGIECSHHHSRGNWSIRFDPLNAEALCTACHFKDGGTEERRRAVLTDAEQDILWEKKRDSNLGRFVRKTKGKGEIAKHYRDEAERMRKLREDGETGRIEFVGWT